MADEAEDTLDLDLEQDETPENQSVDEPDEGSDPPARDEDDSEPEELEVAIGDEVAEPATGRKPDSDLIRKLRAEIRDRDQRLAVYTKEEAPKPIEVGPRPTIEEHDYDADKHAEAVEAWFKRRSDAQAQEADLTRAQEVTKTAWAAELADFNKKKTAMRAKDFNVAEEEVVSALTPIQQASIVKASENSAQVIYALGKHPKRLAELAAISDPVKFIAAVVRLEGTIKVTPRRQAPDVDTPVRGSAPLATRGVDKVLERLEIEADKTGDRTKVIAHKKALRDKQRK